MKKRTGVSWWAPAFAGAVLVLSTAAHAAVWMDGDVTLDYYVAEVDVEGFERTEAELYVERVVNDGAAGSGALSLSGWFTADPSPAGAGDEVGYLPFGSIPGNSSYGPVWDAVDADDVAPGEYYPHMLLQHDADPEVFDDARSLAPRVLWRGGLEAVGPLDIVAYAGGTEVSVDFAELRNNRVDSRYTNDILLTLYATYGYGPASDGYVVCQQRVSGLYAGDWRYAPGFDCVINPVPDGGYTLHLEVAEVGGRGGYSTLSGPDVRFDHGRLDDGRYCCAYVDGSVYVSGALGPWWALPLLAALIARRARRFRRAAAAPG